VSSAGRTDAGGSGERDHPQDANLASLLEDSTEDLYENAPCGYLSTRLDGTIAKVNATLLGWLGYTRADLVGRRHFADLLTVGGKLYHETHFAPLLRMQGHLGGIALELRKADGGRLPVLVTSTVRTGADGQPRLIRTTVFDARDRRAYEQELLRGREVADRERARLQQVLGVLQRSLLPPSLPVIPGLAAAAYYHPASTDDIGGDFYDLFTLGDGNWGFFLGDVCGKGATAASVTSLARYTLRATATYDPDPAVVLGNLNTVLYQEIDGDALRYCTAVVGSGRPDGDGFVVTIATGGHPPPLLLRSDGTADYLPGGGGPLVGILADATFTATTYRLDPGDTLLVYTDGLTDARTSTVAGRSDSHYDSHALRMFAAGLAPTTAVAAIEAVRTLLAGFGEGLDDDAAVLAISVPR
jgi:phosphoserine phosphatase RsbU/P